MSLDGSTFMQMPTHFREKEISFITITKLLGILDYQNSLLLFTMTSIIVTTTTAVSLMTRPALELERETVKILFSSILSFIFVENGIVSSLTPGLNVTVVNMDLKSSGATDIDNMDI